MPVIVVTHNNTVGATIKPDYILYAQKSKDDKGGVKYRLYSGYPTDKHLKSIDDFVISNFEVLMNSLEAGKDAYEGRRQKYEAIES